MNLTLLLFLLLLLEQALLSPVSSYPKIISLGIGITLCWFIAHTKNWLWWLFAAGLAAAHQGLWLIAIFYMQWYGSKITILNELVKQLNAARPSFLPAFVLVHSNEVAGLVVLAAPVGIVGILAGYTLLTRRQIVKGILLFITASGWSVINLFIIVLTQSRATWVGYAAAIAIVGLGWGSRLRWAALIVVLLLAVGVYFGRNHPAVATQLQALQGLSETKTVAQALNPASLTYRLRLWSNALLMVQDFGFTGTGLDQLRRLVPTLPLYYSFGNEDVAHAHNMLLHTAVELGIPGLVVYLAFLIQLVIAARQALHPARTRLWQRSAAWGLAGGLLAHFVFGLTDAVALGALPGVFWWAQAGLLLALASNVATREQSRHGAALLGLSASAKPAQ